MPNNLAFDLRVERLTSSSGENSGGDDLTSVSLLSPGGASAATTDGAGGDDGDVLLLTSTSRGGETFRLVRIPRSVEQCCVRLLSRYDAVCAFAVENGNATGEMMTLPASLSLRGGVKNSEASPGAARARGASHEGFTAPSDEESRLVETPGRGADESELAVGCTRMFPLRLDDGSGPHTHIILSYGGASLHTSCEKEIKDCILPFPFGPEPSVLFSCLFAHGAGTVLVVQVTNHMTCVKTMNTLVLVEGRPLRLEPRIEPQCCRLKGRA